LPAFGELHLTVVITVKEQVNPIFLPFAWERNSLGFDVTLHQLCGGELVVSHGVV